MSDGVQQIKERLSIIDVVSPYIEIHKAGKNFKARCPFHSEKTPSFHISPDRGMYHCYGCGAGGDIFNFIQEMEAVDFKGALKILAEKAGVELVPEDPQKKSERDRLYAAMEAATFFYQTELQKETEALEYLERRKVKPETISAWRIGYAPGPPNHGWREVKEFLTAKEYTSGELLKAGLIKTTDSGKEPFDTFRDRIMFPMAEPSGKIVAFSGRILHPDERAPKYVNSPETELYKKSDLLFGYDKAKSGIRHLNFSLIVEGQFDVVMCHQAGYSNAVAVSGTALTLHHVQLLERLSEKVVLALDADRAGIAAMKKAADVMLRRGLDVKVAELPLGEDPADMIAKDPAAFKQVIGHSVHVIEFLLHVLRREVSDDRSFKLKTRAEVLPFILLLPSRIDQEHFAGIVAESLGTPIDSVRYEIERLREKEKLAVAEHVQVSTPPASINATSSASGQLAQYHLFLRAVVSIIDGPLQQAVERVLQELPEEGELSELSSSELSGTIFALEQQFADLSKLTVQEEVLARLNHFRVVLFRQRLARLRQAFVALEVAEDEAAFAALLQNISKCEQQLREPAYTAEELGCTT